MNGSPDLSCESVGERGSVSGMTASSPHEKPPSAAEVRRALREPSVRRAVARAVRDARLRVAFAALRADGQNVETAIETLCGPHADIDGRPYYLSVSRVRSIVYPTPSPG